MNGDLVRLGVADDVIVGDDDDAANAIELDDDAGARFLDRFAAVAAAGRRRGRLDRLDRHDRGRNFGDHLLEAIAERHWNC